MLIVLIQRNCHYLTNHESIGKIINCARNVDEQMRARKDSNIKLLISKIDRGERKEYELFKTTVRKKITGSSTRLSIISPSVNLSN